MRTSPFQVNLRLWLAYLWDYSNGTETDSSGLTLFLKKSYPTKNEGAFFSCSTKGDLHKILHFSKFDQKLFAYNIVTSYMRSNAICIRYNLQLNFFMGT